MTLSDDPPAPGTESPAEESSPICLTASEPPVETDLGTELDVSGLAGWLHRSGWAVEIVASRRRPDRSIVDDVPLDLLRTWGEQQWPQGLDPASAAVTGTAFRLRRLTPWVVHATLLADAMAARLAGFPYVLSLGGMVMPESFTGRPELWQLFRLAVDGAAAVVVPSDAAAGHLAAMFGIDALSVPNGVDAAALADGHEQRQPGLVFVPLTGDEPRERAEVAVDAFDRLGATIADSELVLAGDLPATRRRQLTERMAPAQRPRVRFLGAEGRARRAVWVARASVVLQPAVDRASGQVLLEALASGTPVVASRHGGHGEVVTRDVGELFTADDPDAAAASLDRVLRRGAGDRLVEACRRRAQAFDWSSVGPRLVEIYRRSS